MRMNVTALSANMSYTKFGGKHQVDGSNLSFKQGIMGLRDFLGEKRAPPAGLLPRAVLCSDLWSLCFPPALWTRTAPLISIIKAPFPGPRRHIKLQFIFALRIRLLIVMVQSIDTVVGGAFTENGAASLATSGTARVDLFFKLTRDVVENKKFIEWLEASWVEDPLDTLKLLFNSRDCRGGKGDRAPFVGGMTWISENYSEWFVANLEIVPTYGRWLDLVELLPHVKDEHCELISEVLGKQLEQDVSNMVEGKGVSLAAKWVPTERKKWDVKCNTTERLCGVLYGDDTSQSRKRLRTEIVTPLRQYIDVVEKRMCTGDWENIKFSKVPSVAMTRLRKAFRKHVPESFEAWLEQVKAGEKKINASQVYPHTLVGEVLNGSDGTVDEVIEEQWKAIVKKTGELGTFNRSLVVSDVSGSMMGTPMEVSVALGILIATLTTPPFDGLLITFSSEPKFHSLRGLKTLHEKAKSVEDMDWGGTTNIQKVFEIVLERAVDYQIPKESMPERIYILSDMQFDHCVSGGTNHEGIKGQYDKYGYDLPEIVFWNLRSNTTMDVPVGSNEEGVALISGFSPAILKAVMGGENITPYWVMRNTIDDVRYDLVKRPGEEHINDGKKRKRGVEVK